MKKLMKFQYYIFVLLILSIPQILCGMTHEEYTAWWKTYRENPKIPAELKQMEDYYINSGMLKHSSKFWNYVNKKNIEQLTNDGYDNFKQTISTNYFTWTTSLDDPYLKNLVNLMPKLTIKLPPEEMNRIHDFLGSKKSFLNNASIEYLLNYIVKIGEAKYLDKLEEPLIGNPPFVLYQNKRITQDIFNSLLEYLPITQHCELSETATVIEVGAGSGRTAFCFMSLMPNVKYVIVDFPPALYVSQRYLSEVFPQKKVMKFRPFKHFEEIAKEYSKADIIFISPDQLVSLPKDSADLFIAIDCLHEMNPNRIAYYFNEAERLCSFIYYKNWINTTIPFDGHKYTVKSYPVHPEWKQLFNDSCVVPSDFFHAFYKID